MVPPPNGGSFFYEQSKMLHQKGHEVGVVYAEKMGITNASFRKVLTRYFQTSISVESGLKTVRIHSWSIPKFEFLQYKVWVWLMIRGVKKYIKQFGCPDIIHVHSSMWGGVVAAKIKEIYGIPYVITEHRGRFGYITDLAKSKFESWYDKPLNEALKNADMVIPVSKRLISKLQSYVPEKSLPVNVIPNVVDIDFFENKLSPQKSNQPFRFLIIASCSPAKAMDQLIKAYAIVKQDIADIELVIGGDGPEKGGLEALCNQLNLTDSIMFLGHLSREHVRAELAKCDFFVLPSLIEAQPVVICEALSMGIPVLSTTVVSDDVVQPLNGILVAPDNMNALAKGLSQAIQTVGQYDSVSIRKFAIEQFSYDAVLNQIESVYDAILN